MFDRTVRSPSYPSISLPDAVERLRMLYEHEGTTPADREVIAKAIGYTGRNGASDAIIAAMGHYGLIEEIGNKRLRVSGIGIDILLGEPGDEQRERAIEIAANTPKLFSELSQEFGSGRFSNRNVESYLIRRQFNPKAATKAAKAYRDTMEYRVRETRASPSSDTMESVDRSMLVEKAPPSSVPQPAFQASTSQRSFSIPIDEDFEVQLLFSGQLTDERIETLIEYLQIMQRRFARRQLSTFDDQETHE